MLPLLVWLTPDLRIKKSLLKCNWTIRKRLPRCKMRLKKRLLAFSRRLHARIRDRKSGSAGMPRPISYAVFCLKKKTKNRTLAVSFRESYKKVQTTYDAFVSFHTTLRSVVVMHMICYFCHLTVDFFLFLNNTPNTEIYTLSLHDALPILKCNWTIRKRLPRCKMRLKKRLLAFSRRLHARIRKTRYMHKMRCLLINRRSLLLALRLLWKTPIFPSNSRFPRLC